MPPQQLRSYQTRGLAQIMSAYRGGAQSVLAVSPTGSGKTTLFSHLGTALINGGRRVLLVVHRRELASQGANRLREFGVDFGYIMAGEPARPWARMQIASVQTLVNRTPPPAELVIFDEAHLSTAKTWQTVREAYPAARILGVTATPWRLSGKPLAGAYDSCVVVATPAELREQGHLCAYVGFSYKTPDLSGVSSTAGDYNEKQSAEVMSSGVIVDNIVEEYVAHARHLSAVVFAVTVEHSKQLCSKFQAAGVTAEHLDGKTSTFEREAILKRVAEGRTMVLCNVGVAVEGLDIPRLKCCILARPTKSLSRAIQMMGRVRRPWNGVTARIHDHAFNIRLHGLPDADRDYSLDAAPQKDALAPVRTCPKCFANFEGNKCPGCNEESEDPAVTERKLKTIADAEKVEFDSGSSTPSEPESPAEPRPPVDVAWNTPAREVSGIFLERGFETTNFGTRKTYLIKGEKRDYKLPGTTDLDAKMIRVRLGSQVWITYLEERAIGGDKRKKFFKVEVDDAA